MADPLEHYRRKRDFTQTREPQGATGRTGKARSFVIQKHAARRLHYDFRLELDGTLKSWAVPKGPSLDPSDKRMAVHVEDHPLEYGGFEGTIPAGQYGAGHVIVWDRGEWIPVGDPAAGYREGKLKFELRGHKLSGGWTLVRMKAREGERQESWLLIKEKDVAARPAQEYDVLDARPESVLSTKKPTRSPPRAASRSATADQAALPETLAPQLATLSSHPPTDPGWVCEIKFDGYRLLARIEGGHVRLVSRNANDWTRRLKHLAKAVGDLGLEGAWIDGELVKVDRHGIPSFQELQNALGTASPEGLVYFVFDAPYLDGEDLRSVPLRDRRERLRIRLGERADGPVRFSESFARTPVDLLRSACALGTEGVVVKREDAAYISGRTTTWLKLKCTERQEFVIGGYTDPAGGRQGLGALLLGLRDADAKLRFVGRVGTGFNGKTLKDLRARLDRIGQSKPPFAELPRGVRGHWVRPTLVAEVSFAQWTHDRLLRQAVFHGLREDKPANAVGFEPRLAEAPRAAERPSGEAGIQAGFPDMKLTHPERVIDATTGITKAELAAYYAAAAPRVLAAIGKRPVSLLRGPDGIGGELFFQKHAKGPSMPGIRTLDPELDPDHPPYLQVATRKALGSCVQMNVIEFHTWNARVPRLEKPDRIVFDLDPGEGLAWARMQEGAQLVRALLHELDLECWLKTSGGKGLHVTVPFVPRHDWDTASGLAKAVVAHLARTMPDRFVLKSGPRNRVGRIFVDYLRNKRGATTAAAWCVRARPGMGVSVPVTWDELGTLEGGDHWNIRNVAERLAAPDRGVDVADGNAQSLRSALRVLLPDR